MSETPDFPNNPKSSEAGADDIIQSGDTTEQAEAFSNEEPEGVSASESPEAHFVKVRRSDGSIEDDWRVVEVFGPDEGNKVRVEKTDPDHPGKVIQKDVPRDEFDDWQTEENESAPDAVETGQEKDHTPEQADQPRPPEADLYKSLLEAQDAERKGEGGEYVKHLASLTFQISKIARERGLSKDEHIEFAESILKQLKTRDKREEASWRDMLDIGYISDLRREYNLAVESEKSRREKLQDTEPVDTFAANERRRLIEKYASTGKKRELTAQIKQHIEKLLEMSDEAFSRELAKEEGRLAGKPQKFTTEKWPNFELKPGDKLEIERSDGSGEQEEWEFKSMFAKDGELYLNLERTATKEDEATGAKNEVTVPKIVSLRSVMQPTVERKATEPKDDETLEEAAKPKTPEDFKELGTSARIKRLMAVYTRELVAGTFYYPTAWYKKMKAQGSHGKEKLDVFLLRKYTELNLTDAEKKQIRLRKIARITGSVGTVAAGLGFGLGFGL